MSKKLFSDAEIQRLRKLFQEFDKDGSGAISTTEAEQSINKFGIKISEQKLLQLVTKVDSNKSGTIEFVEFLKFATFAREDEIENEKAAVKAREFSSGAVGAAAGESVKSRDFNSGAVEATGSAGAGQKSEELPENLLAKIRKLFKEFDADGSGSIEAAEISKLMEKFGVKLTLGQVNGLIKLVDVDDSGEVDLDEFIELVRLALYPGSKPRVKKEKEAKSRSLNAPGAGGEEQAVKSRSFNAPGAGGEEQAVKSRSFNAPGAGGEQSDGSTSLAVAVEPNSDAAGNVDFFGTLPLTLRNKLALTTPVRPFNFVLKEALVSGTYKIQLISQLYAPAWGRWAGLVKPENVNLKEYHIINDNALDHDIVQISILGVKSGGKWRYKKADYVQPAGRVDLVLEYQTAAGTLLASWNGQTLPFGVNNIPQGQQRFTFELPNELELTIQSLVKVPTPTLKATGHFDFYSY